MKYVLAAAAVAVIAIGVVVFVMGDEPDVATEASQDPAAEVSDALPEEAATEQPQAAAEPTEAEAEDPAEEPVDDEEAAMEEDPSEPDGECVVDRQPGRRAIAWLTFLTDGPVPAEGATVGDRFVMSNHLYMDVPEAGGAVIGNVVSGYAEGTDIYSIGSIFAPSFGTVVDYDAATETVSGVIPVRVTLNTDGPNAVDGDITAEFSPDGTVTGTIDHPDLDLAFEGTWEEMEYAYTEDPDCRETEPGS